MIHLHIGQILTKLRQADAVGSGDKEGKALTSLSLWSDEGDHKETKCVDRSVLERTEECGKFPPRNRSKLAKGLEVKLEAGGRTRKEDSESWKTDSRKEEGGVS